MTPDPDLQRTRDAALAGDRHALESLFGRNLPRLMAFIRLRMDRKVGARESVSDIAQSVCREVLADMDGFEERGDEAFRKWLFMQATRKLLDRHRYHTRERRDIAREVAGPAPDSTDDEVTGIAGAYAGFAGAYADLGTPTRLGAAREELERIEDALRQLPDNQREAVAMVRLMGLSSAEAAERLGTTDGAVRSLVARGLAKLSTVLRLS